MKRRWKCKLRKTRESCVDTDGGNGDDGDAFAVDFVAVVDAIVSAAVFVNFVAVSVVVVQVEEVERLPWRQK